MADTTYTATESSPAKITIDNTVSPGRRRVVKPKSPKAKMTKQATSSPASVNSKPGQLKRPQSKSPGPSKLPKAPRLQNPTMLSMMMEALQNNKSIKGLTLQGMKRYITETYPDTQESFSNARLRTALLKGLELNEVIRPKSSEETGVKGYFLLNRALHSQKEKVKKQAKVKKSVADKDDKQSKKGVSKVAKRKISKSPSTRKPVAKAKTTKSKAKTPEAIAKTPEAIAKTPEAKAKTPESKPSSEKKKPKAVSDKKVVKKKTKKATASKSHTPKATGTPKLSKPTKAGVRQKTAAVKKLIKSTD